mmetsp:Transcript_23591/g.27163  ORF Transcript_23591/g.27163 Transcript_23591/m.27163 type:complete len:114 (+) Transcript_23591:191-532(+)
MLKRFKSSRKVKVEKSPEMGVPDSIPSVSEIKKETEEETTFTSEYENFARASNDADPEVPKSILVCDDAEQLLGDSIELGCTEHIMLWGVANFPFLFKPKGPALDVNTPSIMG